MLRFHQIRRWGECRSAVAQSEFLGFPGFPDWILRHRGIWESGYDGYGSKFWRLNHPSQGWKVVSKNAQVEMYHGLCRFKMFKFACMLCHCITWIHKAMTVLFESHFIFKPYFLSPSHSVVLQKLLPQHRVSTAVLVIFATFFPQQGMLNGKTEDWVAWFWCFRFERVSLKSIYSIGPEWPRYLASYQPVSSILGAILVHSCRFQMSPAGNLYVKLPQRFRWHEPAQVARNWDVSWPWSNEKGWRADGVNDTWLTGKLLDCCCCFTCPEDL